MDNDFDDDLIVESSNGGPESQNQKELFCNKLLPYATEIEAEAQSWFSDIKANLGRAILLREIRPGCSLWTGRLCK